MSLILKPTPTQKTLLERIRKGDRLVSYNTGRILIHTADPHRRLTVVVASTTVESLIRHNLLMVESHDDTSQAYTLSHLGSEMLAMGRQANDETRANTAVNQWEVAHAARN